MSKEGLDKTIALAKLREYAKWSTTRDTLVCDAYTHGASYTEIVTASGLARGTVNNILINAGLAERQIR